MPDVWVIAVATAAVVAAGIYLVIGRRAAPVVFASEREEQLARRLARMVGCAVGAAVPSVRTELRIAPDQTDETLLKRAAYHYRQNLPERTCGGYRDRAPG